MQVTGLDILYYCMDLHVVFIVLHISIQYKFIGQQDHPVMQWCLAVQTYALGLREPLDSRGNNPRSGQSRLISANPALYRKVVLQLCVCVVDKLRNFRNNISSSS
jgi:hypothetical protein